MDADLDHVDVVPLPGRSLNEMAAWSACQRRPDPTD
jgi:hypothetical protein